ncbi:hypothetical protein ARMGADRAFT_1031473 [Armillaria gallica]|uniref:Reverse transcriptase domain-containing protein n=1 Tax=Armillaria gallica TaxID=47427 RepID=A0A2H3DUQ8_ARMGA|nr:hypothetical protein ARMGADRAFT_1031473 [Armillaria gallica]
MSLNSGSTKKLVNIGNNKPSPGPDGWEKCYTTIWLTIQPFLEMSRMCGQWHYTKEVYLGIIPDTQVATQQGVQTQDLMSYLAGVETWAKHHKQPVWCIKHDQMKSFNYLSLQEFHDVIWAYGLPSEIIKLDTAV